MRLLIDSLELLEEVVETELKPYCADRNNILALDAETYNTSLAGTVVEEPASEEVFVDEPELVDEVVAQLVIEAIESLKTVKPKKGKKKPNIVPRPLLLANGSLTGVMRTLQLGLSPDNVASLGGKQFVIDLDKIGYLPAARLLKPLLENQLILGHNLKYDFQFLYACMGIHLNRMIDTMLVSKILGAGVDKGYALVDLYDRCIDYKWFVDNFKMDFKKYKDEVKKANQLSDWSVPELSDGQFNYAADDVYFIHIVWEKLKANAKLFREVYETDLPSHLGTLAVIKLECSSIPMYSFMEYRGVKIDIAFHRDIVLPRLKQSRDDAESKIDLNRTYTKKCQEGRGQNKRIWEETITEKISLTSPEQLKYALFELVQPHIEKHRIIMKTLKSGKEKIDKIFVTFPGVEEIMLCTEEALFRRFLNEDEIRDCLPDSLCEVLKDILQFKQAASLMSKFGQKLIDSCTDRGYIHPSWHQIGTESGRMSCSGPNFQQIPRKGVLRDGSESRLEELFRSSICAEIGWVLIGADYSQIEARYAAKWCKQKYLVDKYNSGVKVDIHGENGKAFLGLDYIPQKGDEARDTIGKTGGFSVLYGAYPKKLKRFLFDETDGKVNWSVDEAKLARRRFFDNYPEFETAQIEYHDLVESLPRENDQNLYPFRFFPKESRTLPYHIARGELGLRRPRQFALPHKYMFLSRLQLHKRYEMTPDDRFRHNLKFGNFYSAQIDQAAREGFNHSIQSSTADLLKIAAKMFHERFVAAGMPMDEGIIILNHDEVLLHVREEHAIMAKALLEKCMLEANDVLESGIAVEAEAKIGRTWYEVH